MPAKLIKVDFFNMIMPQGQDPFGELLRSVGTTEPEIERWDTVKNSPICISNYSEKGDLIEGDMQRLRVGDGAMKGKMSAVELEEIELDHDEALAETSAFLYHIPTSTLALERNRIGVGITAFAAYFEKKGDIKPIIAEPIMKEEAFTKLQTVKDIRTFSFRIAGLSDAGLFSKSGKTGSQILALMRRFNSPSIEIRFSMDHNRGSLNKPETIGAAEELYKTITEKDYQVKKMVLTGNTDHDGKTVLDFIEDRMEFEITVQKDGRNLLYNVRRRIVKEAWLHYKPSLLRMRKKA